MLLNLLYWALVVIITLFIVWRLLLIAYGYWLYAGLKKQGVPFLFGYNYFTGFYHLAKMRQNPPTT
jgi:hypothetical protein